MTSIEQNADLILAHVVMHDTVCYDDLADRLTYDQWAKAIGHIRKSFGAGGDVNLVGRPVKGAGSRWSYRFVDDLASATWWITNRLGDAETRIRTVLAIVAPIVKATSGRTRQGKRARAIELSLRHLIERLDQIEAEEAAEIDA